MKKINALALSLMLILFTLSVLAEETAEKPLHWGCGVLATGPQGGP